MDVLDGPYYYYSKKNLCFFGGWPLQATHTKWILRVVNFLACLSAFIPFLCKAYELRNNLFYFLLCIPSISFKCQFLTKYYCLVSKDDKYKRLFELIKEDFCSYTGESLRTLHEYAKSAQKINKVVASDYLFITVCLYNMPCFIPVILDVVMPLNFSRPKRAPRLIKYNIPQIENNFYVIAIHTFVLDFIGVSLVVGFDTLMLICTQHSCALFKIVSWEIRAALDRNKWKSAESIKGRQSVIYREVIRVIKMHKRALEFVDLVQSIYCTSQLFIVGLTLVTITLAEFETAQQKQFKELRYRFGIYCITELLHILLHNLPGQRVIDHSVMVYNSCYESEWYREDVPDECKKLIKLMIMRSQKPSELTGGKFFVLGLENYARILQASLSYFTFLSSV